MGTLIPTTHDAPLKLAHALDHFGLDRVSDLPGLDELKGAGLIEGRVAKGFTIPTPRDEEGLRDDEEPLENELLDAEPDASSDETARQEARDLGPREGDPD